jgi:hypothetical protein
MIEICISCLKCISYFLDHPRVSSVEDWMIVYSETLIFVYTDYKILHEFSYLYYNRESDMLDNT